MRLPSLALASCAVFLISGCGDQAVSPANPEAPAGVPANGLDPLLAAASREFNVPGDLLKAIRYAETRWQMVKGEVEFAGMPAAFGVMALRGERLEAAARLAGASPERVRTDAAANIHAGAAHLSSYAEELKLNRALRPHAREPQTFVGSTAPRPRNLCAIDWSTA